MMYWRKTIPPPEAHFFALLAIGLIFIFLCGLYLAIFILGRWETREKKRTQ